MRKRLFLITFALLVPGASVIAQDNAPIYRIEKEQVEKDGKSQDRVHVVRRMQDGKPTLFITTQFRITRDGQPVYDIKKNEFVVKEDRLRVPNPDVLPPNIETLTTVLAIDISGSMVEHGKIQEAKQAARTFLDQLKEPSKCGLILFDHLLRDPIAPTADTHRLRARIDAARPGGGTAYLDATARAVEMLRDMNGRRAVLLLTDGVDLNSRRSMQDVIREANAAGVAIYTIGVGEPGRNTPVTSVLVLDCSGSMDDPADDSDEVSKIQALRQAASRFIDIMRPGARTTLLPFSDEPDPAKPFTADKRALKDGIRDLRAGGQTALFDATYEAIETLAATRPEGKRAVVVLTDGQDNKPGGRRVEQVIAAARRAEIPLHMLGLGRPGELDERVMRKMAEQTGGTYHHARNRQALYEIFENLSIQLHDDGIDEAALKKLAEDTNGKYFPARDVTQLKRIYQDLARELQTTYQVTFPSLRQDDDGTSRDIDISIWRDGRQISDVFSAGYNVHGVVVPKMDAATYLILLALIGALLLLPAGMRRYSRQRAPSPS
ncbi:MAG TPA: VWA domain-containing protein [Gemmataceae bacterium]|jgi:VWFA-related protein|nr:VWA domain-containing protein [Gemmataceae bacterium]